MKKIAIFSGYYLPHVGGVERYTANLAKQLKEYGYEVVIVTSKWNKELKEKEVIEGITIYRLPIYTLTSGRYPIIKKNSSYRATIKQLEEEKIDSILLNTRFQLTSLVGAKFAKKQQIPVSLIEHGTSHFTVYNKVFDFFGHQYEHLLTSRMKQLVTNFYGVSKACCNWLEHYKIQAKGVWYNAIAKEEYEQYISPKKTTNIITIAYVGRFLKDKGILLLKSAYQQLENKGYPIQLMLIGEGPLEQELKRELPKAIFTGKLSHEEVMKHYCQIDIVINPSYTEGLPTTLLEAGLMECALIATPVGGTIEIIEDGISGVFCDTTVDSIVQKLEELLQDPEKRKRLAKKSHEKIDEVFTWEKTASKILETITFKGE